MTYWKKPETLLKLWETIHAAQPEYTQQQHAADLCIPIAAYKSRLADAIAVRDIARSKLVPTQAGAVTTFAFDAPDDWSQWFLFMADNHHDSVFCNRELETEHLQEAVRRGAIVMIFGDLLDAMQGKFDPRRSMDELRPEYRRNDYYDFLVEDSANFYAPYAKYIGLVTDGNHELTVLKNSGTDIVGRLVTELNRRTGAQIKRGGYGGWVRLVLSLGNKMITKRIKYYHGSGGEAPVTRGVIQTNRQAVYLPDADIVVNGHSHNSYYIPISRERLGDDGEHYFDIQHHVRVPGYKQGYGDGTAGWEVTRGGVPKPIGAVWVQMMRRGGGVVCNVISDIRGADPISTAPGLFSGKVFDQDPEGV
jgi:hypothetical protein